MDVSLLMDAMRRAESDPETQPENTPDSTGTTPLALETVEATTDTPPANEAPPQPQTEVHTSPVTPPADHGQIVEARLKSTRPTTRIVIALLAGVALAATFIGGYFYWKQPTHQHVNNRMVDLQPAFVPATPQPATTVPAKAAPVTGIDARTVSEAQRLQDQASQVAVATQSPPAAEQPPARIEIHRSRGNVSVDPMLAAAYSAYTHKDYQQAGKLYSRVLRRQPQNRDALLGIAGVSILTGDTDAARHYYEKLLSMSPADNTARAALQAMEAGIDPLYQSSQLQHMIESDRDNAHLHFALGNRYLELGEWSKAQQSYFNAVRLDPDQPDYNYNLAVSLDHLGMNEQALSYYQRAQERAASSAILFDRKQLAKRIYELKSAGDRQP